MRWDIWPADYRSVAWPPPGRIPVPLISMSSKIKDKFENIAMMLNPAGMAEVADSELKPYIGPHFKVKKNLLALVVRMAQCGVIRSLPVARSTVGIFSVVKKVESVDDVE